MTTFAAILAALALAGAALIAGPLLFARDRERPRAARERDVFRDQLAEIERDLARGTISAAEAEGAKAEISRRLIRADAAAKRAGTPGPAPRALSRAAAGLAFLAVPAVAAAVYLYEGAPGTPDLPFAERSATERAEARLAAGQPLSQAEAEAVADARRGPRPAPSGAKEQEYARQIERLEEVLADRPEDIRGRELMADAYMRQRRFAEARRVLQELARLKGPRADGDLYARTAEAMVLAAGGYVSPEAERALDQALTLDPQLPMARYYQGVRLAQEGRPDMAAATWEALRRDAPEETAAMPWLDRMIADARQAMGPRGGRPADGGERQAALPGPDRESVAAGADMSPEERQAMIEGMVSRLETRLTGEGGSPEEWVRLINAYRVLGRPEAARRAYDLSQDALTGSEAGFVREQALVLGVIGE